MAAHEAITLLHLSDIQFGRYHRFGNLGLTEADAQFDTLFQRLNEDLTSLENKQGVIPQLLVVSGDLAEWGKKSEFTDVLEFLVKLSERLKLPRRYVVIVPGNHDVNRKLCEGYFSQCEGRDEQLVPPYWPKWEFYHWLFQEFYRDEKDIAFSLEEPWTYWELEDLNLVVAGFNSTMAESHLDKDHYGWLGEAQLHWFKEKLTQAKDREWFRLGVVHHNVQHGALANDENLRDADDLQRILVPSLNLLLHGHTHNSKIGWLSHTLPVLSTGSAAIGSDQRPPEVPNQYQAIRLWPDRIERWTRRYDPEQKRWLADTRCSQGGNDWHIEHKVTSEAVSGTFHQATTSKRRTPRTRTRRDKRGEDERENPAPRDDFLAKVINICKLRRRGAEVDSQRSALSAIPYLRVETVEGSIARISPIGVCEHGLTREWLDTFRREVVATYRSHDHTLPCEVVYGGERASDDLRRQANAAGVRLVSFIEFEGIIDFRSYVEQQTRKLETDLIYPPQLYTSQRLIYERGRRQHDSSDALRDILDWLREPFARFILVLGDFGTGKTFLLHELARRIPVELPHLVPVLIELRSLDKARSFDQLIAQHLADAGERLIDLDAFPYMLREGRIALLFDGFDELVQRVTYPRATEHLDTLLQAAAGRAKVIVTSRTQHFESDQQVKTALLERTETLPGLYLARLQLFDEEQIRDFLEKQLGDRTTADRRFALIHDIRDLLGLSQNPRMLSFIANLPEDQLREAQARTGTITSAELYRLLIERWLTFEYERMQSKGAAPTLSVEERRKAVTLRWRWRCGQDSNPPSA